MIPGGAHHQDGTYNTIRSSGATTISGQSMSTSGGSVGSPSSRSEQAVATPPSDGSTLRLNHLNIHSDDAATNKKKKRGQRAAGADKAGRGLRQFSMKVCEKVESKGTTTYNEVADELVAEFSDPGGSISSPDQQQYDEKNIRRRVYDALNVLMALDIISKDKKEIQWKGLPSTSVSDIEELKTECFGLRSRIDKKTAYLRELEEQVKQSFIVHGVFFLIKFLDLTCLSYKSMGITSALVFVVYYFVLFKYIGMQSLVQRNEQLSNSGNAPSGGVSLPFILVQTRPHATVEVEISEDMQLVHFDFNSTPFELHDDNYVLKAMNLCKRPEDNEVVPNIIGNGGEGSIMSNMLQLQNVPSSTTNTPVRPPISPPIPGIIKARVKNEH